MPTAEARIAISNAARFAGGDVLLVGFDGPDLGEALRATGARSLLVFQHNLRRYLSWRPEDGAILGDWLEAEARFDTALVSLPKERGRLDLQLDMVAPLVRSGGLVGVAGHNDAGVRSVGKHLRLFGPAEPIDYRYHCRLVVAAKGASDTPTRGLGGWRTTSAVEIGGRSIELTTYPGVFAQRGVDPATQMLIEAWPAAAGARVLDVGCGAGPLSAYAAMRGATVDAVDVDALAVRATTETLATNGLNGRVWPSDVYGSVQDRYDVIVSNPPFHSGIRTSSGVAERLIEGAPGLLRAGGELWLVANRFLDYESPLRRAFGETVIVAEDRRYRVFRARGRR